MGGLASYAIIIVSNAVYILTFLLIFVFNQDRDKDALNICAFESDVVKKMLLFGRLTMCELDLPVIIIGIGVVIFKSTKDILNGISKLDYYVKISIFQ
jgi:hypothetical protein